MFFAHVAQLVEHILGKDEVTSSILVVGSFSEINFKRVKKKKENKKFGGSKRWPRLNL